MEFLYIYIDEKNSVNNIDFNFGGNYKFKYNKAEKKLIVKKNENYINSRSRCDYCLHELKWYELIPLFSYIFQRGKCNYCNKNININHFLIELSTGILFCLG